MSHVVVDITKFGTMGPGEYKLTKHDNRVKVERLHGMQKGDITYHPLSTKVSVGRNTRIEVSLGYLIGSETNANRNTRMRNATRYLNNRAGGGKRRSTRRRSIRR
jgi:hypothetical protein